VVEPIWTLHRASGCSFHRLEDHSRSSVSLKISQVAGKGRGDNGGVCSIPWCWAKLCPRPSKDLTFVGKSVLEIFFYANHGKLNLLVWRSSTRRAWKRGTLFCCTRLVESCPTQNRSLFWSIPGWSGRLLSTFGRSVFARCRGGVSIVGFPLVLSGAGTIVVFFGFLVLLSLRSFPFDFRFPVSEVVLLLKLLPFCSLLLGLLFCCWEWISLSFWFDLFLKRCPFLAPTLWSFLGYDDSLSWYLLAFSCY
jgi:hypothetical protein